MYRLAKHKQQGATLLVVLMLLLVMMVLAISIAANTSSHAMISNNSVLKKQAYQAAESGSDVILALLNDFEQSPNDLKAKPCSASFNDQYNNRNGQSSEIASSGDGLAEQDKRGISLTWYACVPDNISEIRCPNNTTNCLVVVITGVACPRGASITNASTRDSCVVSRHLQSYGILTSK